MLRKLAGAALIAGLFLAQAATTASAAPVEFVDAWGTRGTAAGEFEYPYGVAVDSHGDVYVSDHGNHRIQKFDASGNHLATIGEEGSAPGQFAFPMGLAIDAEDNLYVADFSNYRVQKLDPSGAVVDIFHETNGDDNPTLGGVSDVAVDPSGFVYVTEPYRHRVHKFTPSGNWGTRLGSSIGDANGQFAYPNGVEVDSQGWVYVSDTENHRIQKFSSAGSWKATWGSQGDGPGEFTYPRGITVDPHGRLNVADPDNYRIQVLDTSGNYLDEWGNYPTDPSGIAQMEGASEIAWNDRGEVFAVDGMAHRIVKSCDPALAQTPCPPEKDVAPPQPEFDPQTTPEADSTAPETRIVSGPKGKTRKRMATFEFAASEPGATFQCTSNHYPVPLPCSAKHRIKGYRGKNEIRVFAVDSAGNADPTPAKRVWKVKRRK